MNNYGASFPYTFFGLEPGTTKADVRACLERWNEGDNGIRYLSKAYRLEVGTGWYVPAGLLPRRAASAPTSRSGPATSSPCSSRWCTTR